jgi:hypothetical protein
VVVIGDHSFGLFDQDARFERSLKLGSDDMPVGQPSFLEDADFGNVDDRVGRHKPALLGAALAPGATLTNNDHTTQRHLNTRDARSGRVRWAARPFGTSRCDRAM